MGERLIARPLLGGRFHLGDGPVPVRRLGQASPGCNYPAGYGPGGRAVVGCSIGNGLYNVVDAASGSPVMSAASADCLKQFGSWSIAPPGDPRCGGAGSPSLDPCGISADLIYRPLIACPSGGAFNIIDPATNTVVMSNVSQGCLANFRALTISTAQDPRCSGAQPAPPPIISNPGARQVTFPLTGMQFPWKGDAAPIQPIGQAKTIYDVQTNPPGGGIPAGPAAPAPLQPIPPAAPAGGAVPTQPLPQPTRTYAPGEPIPVADWFGICKQMKGTA